MDSELFQIARRARRLQPSMIRELMKLAGQPGLVSLGGGLPAADSFPVQALQEAAARVLGGAQARNSLQYATTEGLAPLREWVACRLRAQGLTVQAAQVLITSGSQQGLDLVAKVTLEEGARAAVEAPTYLGALQAFAPYEATVVTVRCDALGPLPDALAAARGARLLYLLPNFQNPTGRCIPADRRVQIVHAAQALKLPLLEDDPYGDLWFDTPPPPPLAALWPEGTVYLGSFSKILAPGLRLGYLVAPAPLFARLVQAKQAADLHSSTFAQHLVHELLQAGTLQSHLQGVRHLYRAQRDAMSAALQRHLRGRAQWVEPGGGMFFWLHLPPQLDAAALLPLAVKQGVSFVPGAAFFAAAAQHHTLRLSFVTESPQRIDEGVAVLAAVIDAAWKATAGPQAPHPVPGGYNGQAQ